MFQPKINDNSKKILSNETPDRYGTGSSNNVGEMLYRNSFNRRLRKMLAQKRLDEYDEFVRNKSKASKRTLSIMRRVLIRDIEIAFHATSGLRTQTVSPTVLIDIEAKEIPKGDENDNDDDYVMNQDAERQEADANNLVEMEELLHTMYILNFLPSATIGNERGNEGSFSDASKDLKDSRFVTKLWKVLASKNVAEKRSASNADGIVALKDLKKFLLRVVYPGASSRKIRQTHEPDEGSIKAPVVTVDLGLDSHTDNYAPNKMDDDGNSNISTSETTGVLPQKRLLYSSMIREVRHVYKKAMPSGYRSIESRQKHDASLGISPTSSPQNSGSPSKIVAHKNRDTKEKMHSLDLQQLSECTFQPKINEHSRILARETSSQDHSTNFETSGDEQESRNNSAQQWNGGIKKSGKLCGNNRREDILLAKHQLSKGKQALARKAQREFESKQCTFQPDLSQSKKSLSYLSKRKSKNSCKKVVEEVPLTTEEREFRDHCTFKPKLLSKSKKRGNENRKQSAKSYGQRDTWLTCSTSTSSSHNPRAYEQAITRMRQAHAKKVQAKHLLDVHSTLRSGHRVSPSKDVPDGHRDASGRLKAEPFSFSTRARQEHRAHQKSLKQLGYRKTDGRLLRYSRGTDPMFIKS